ncbi:stage V sporulation protein SpoVS [Duganella sp. SG902]|nr:hypothetical protein [Duganella sp. SG902]NVM75845.1 stage V sporulation protein SpoVS [Duganella sp. SG902]
MQQGVATLLYQPQVTAGKWVAATIGAIENAIVLQCADVKTVAAHTAAKVRDGECATEAGQTAGVGIDSSATRDFQRAGAVQEVIHANDKPIITRTTIDVRAIPTVGARTCSEVEVIVATAAQQRVVAVNTAADYVVAVACIDYIIAIAGIQRIIPGAPQQHVLTFAAVQRVRPAAAVQLIVAVTANQDVTAIAANQRVITAATIDLIADARIVLVAAGDAIVAITSIQDGGAVATDDRIVQQAAHLNVTAAVGIEQLRLQDAAIRRNSPRKVIGSQGTSRDPLQDENCLECFRSINPIAIPSQQGVGAALHQAQASNFSGKRIAAYISLCPLPRQQVGHVQAVPANAGGKVLYCHRAGIVSVINRDGKYIAAASSGQRQIGCTRCIVDLNQVIICATVHHRAQPAPRPTDANIDAIITIAAQRRFHCLLGNGREQRKNVVPLPAICQATISVEHQRVITAASIQRSAGSTAYQSIIACTAKNCIVPIRADEAIVTVSTVDPPHRGQRCHVQLGVRGNKILIDRRFTHRDAF